MLACIPEMAASKLVLSLLSVAFLHRLLPSQGAVESEIFIYLTPLWRNGKAVPTPVSRQVLEDPPETSPDDTRFLVQDAVSYLVDLKSGQRCMKGGIDGAGKSGGAAADARCAYGFREALPGLVADAAQALEYVRLMQFAVNYAVFAPDDSIDNSFEIFKQALIVADKESDLASKMPAWRDAMVAYFKTFKDSEAELARALEEFKEAEEQVATMDGQVRLKEEVVKLKGEVLAQLQKSVEAGKELDKTLGNELRKQLKASTKMEQDILDQQQQLVERAGQVIKQMVEEKKGGDLLKALKTALEKYCDNLFDLQTVEKNRVVCDTELALAREALKHAKEEQGRHQKTLEQKKKIYQEAYTRNKTRLEFRVFWNAGGPLLPMTRARFEKLGEEWMEKGNALRSELLAAPNEKLGGHIRNDVDYYTAQLLRERLNELHLEIENILQEAVAAEEIAKRP